MAKKLIFFFYSVAIEPGLGVSLASEGPGRPPKMTSWFYEARSISRVFSGTFSGICYFMRVC